MGQRLIISEEEKSRIASLYESMGVAFGGEVIFHFPLWRGTNGEGIWIFLQDLQEVIEV